MSECWMLCTDAAKDANRRRHQRYREKLIRYKEKRTKYVDLSDEDFDEHDGNETIDEHVDESCANSASHTTE